MSDVLRVINHPEADRRQGDQQRDGREAQQRLAPAEFTERIGCDRDDQSGTQGPSGIRDPERATPHPSEPIRHRRRGRHRAEHRHSDRAAYGKENTHLPQSCRSRQKRETRREHKRADEHHTTNRTAVEQSPDHGHRAVHNEHEEAYSQIELSGRRAQFFGERSRKEPHCPQRKADRDRLCDDTGRTHPPPCEGGMR